MNYDLDTPEDVVIRRQVPILSVRDDFAHDLLLQQAVRERDPQNYNPHPFRTQAKPESLRWEAKVCHRKDNQRAHPKRKGRAA